MFFKKHFKDIFYIAIIIVAGIFIWRAFINLTSQVEQSNIAFKSLSEELARAQNELVTRAELESFAKSIGADLGTIKKDLKGLGADLVAVGQTVASLEGKIEENQDSDDSVSHDPPPQPDECFLCDIHSYTAVIQAKDVKIGEMPHARVEFDASQKAPWTVKSDDIDVKVTTAVGELDITGAPLVFYHTISMLNKSRPKLAGKEYKLKITSSEFQQTTSSNKEFYWWAPHLSISLDNQLVFMDELEYKLGASAGISVMAYGRTKDDNEWRFIRLGAGLNTGENLYVIAEPVQYNLGKVLPLVSDLWLGLGAIYDGAWGISITIGSTL